MLFSALKFSKISLINFKQVLLVDFIREGVTCATFWMLEEPQGPLETGQHKL